MSHVSKLLTAKNLGQQKKRSEEQVHVVSRSVRAAVRSTVLPFASSSHSPAGSASRSCRQGFQCSSAENTLDVTQSRCQAPACCPALHGHAYLRWTCLPSMVADSVSASSRMLGHPSCSSLVVSRSVPRQGQEQHQGARRTSCTLPEKKLPLSRTFHMSALFSRIISTCADWTGQLFARAGNLGTPATSAVLRFPRGACTSPIPLLLVIHCCWSGTV